MRLWKSLVFSLVLTCVFSLSGHAQANSLKQISFVFDRYNGYNSHVILRGDNIDVTAQFRSQTAPVICGPCIANTQIPFGPAFDDSGIIAASGTIDGIFYQNLYVMHSLFYSSPTNARIPKLWTKTVRVTSPLNLTGNLGIWRTPQEVGDNSVALYRHQGINFTGMANLVLEWNASSGQRLFTDKYLTLDFVYTD